MLKNKKVISLLAIILIILVAGIVMFFVKGMNYDLLYGDNTTVELYLQTDFNFSDIQNIITETFGSNTKIRTVNNLDYDILITTKSVQDDQLNNLVTKINEKYNLELTTDDLIIINNAKIELIDLINPYILPVCIATVLSLVYFLIRYKKLGIVKIILFTLVPIIAVQLLYLSIYAIVRLPVNQYTMPISMLIYLITIIAVCEKFEKDN